MKTVQFKHSSINRIIILIFHLFLLNITFAQNADTTYLPGKTIDNQTYHNPVLLLNEFQPTIFINQPFNPFGIETVKLNEFNFSNEKNPSFTNFEFRQNKTVNFLPNLGAYEHFNNNLFIEAGNNLRLVFGLGLLKQNSVLNPDKPNFQFTFGTSVEYNINPWLSIYAYGQYLVPKMNSASKLPDPLIFMNPLFFQTEAGGGVRAKYKNIKADVGMKKIFDTQFNQSNPVNSMNTKVSIGF